MTSDLEISGRSVPRHALSGRGWSPRLGTALRTILGLRLSLFLMDSFQVAEVRAAEAGNASSTYRLENVPADAKDGLGDWIWADKTSDRQTCRLWKEFEIPSGADCRHLWLTSIVGR